MSNEGFKASLEVRKPYPVIADEKSGKRGGIRVIDESGEACVFPSEMFLPVQMAPPVEERLAALA
jgi:hypothetical protein